MAPALFHVLHLFGDGVLAFAKSRPGNIAIAFAVAWLWSGHRHDAQCAAEFAAQTESLRNAHALELARESEAARLIAEAATQRAGDDAVEMRAKQAKIDELKAMLATGKLFNDPTLQSQSREGDVKPVMSPRVPCIVDDAFSRGVRDFDAAGRHRKAAPSRRAR